MDGIKGKIIRNLKAVILLKIFLGFFFFLVLTRNWGRNKCGSWDLILIITLAYCVNDFRGEGVKIHGRF